MKRTVSQHEDDYFYFSKSHLNSLLGCIFLVAITVSAVGSLSAFSNVVTTGNSMLAVYAFFVCIVLMGVLTRTTMQGMFPI